MPPPNFIIDGHNLIGQLPGFSLRDLDDENRLVDLLQIYARVARKRIEVFFDGAPPGQAGPRTRGTILAIFVPQGRTADAAIRERLDELGKQARQTTVVTSDRQVQAEARRHGATVLLSSKFGSELLTVARNGEDPLKPPHAGRDTPPKSRPPADADPGPRLSDKEVQEWLDLFQKKKRP